MGSLWLFLGRLLMSSLFLVGAYWHVTNWDTAISKMMGAGADYPSIILIISTLVMFLGGISLLLGYWTRMGAFLLILEILMTAYLFHPFWMLTGAERELSLLAFLTRAAHIGGLLCLMGAGPGQISVDCQLQLNKT